MIDGHIVTTMVLLLVVVDDAAHLQTRIRIRVEYARVEGGGRAISDDLVQRAIVRRRRIGRLCRIIVNGLRTAAVKSTRTKCFQI